MSPFKIIYNPTAGEGDHSPAALMEHFSNKGIVVEPVSTDDPQWKTSLVETMGPIIVAGGDGTVHKVAVEILEQGLDLPLGIHPLGTANNISKTLENLGETRGPHPFDVGKVSGLKAHKYFIESLGFGVFPHFVKAIKEDGDKEEIKRDNKRIAQLLMEVIDAHIPKKTTIYLDKIKLKGKFLLVELLNINYMGPNLNLAPMSRPGDGYFNLCLVPGHRKAEFKEFMARTLFQEVPPDGELGDCFLSIRCKTIKFKSRDSNFHLDDGLVDYSGEKIKMRNLKGRLQLISTLSLGFQGPGSKGPTAVNIP